MSLSLSLLFIIIFYLIGSIPFALLIPKIFGHGDIRNIGSGNVGATNVLRTGNKFLAFLVLCLEVLKGLLPFVLLKLYSENKRIKLAEKLKNAIEAGTLIGTQ